MINVEKEVLEKGKHLKFSCGLAACGRSAKKQALSTQNQDEILINILRRLFNFITDESIESLLYSTSRAT